MNFLFDSSLRNRLIEEETKTLAASQAEREAKNQLQELVRSATSPNLVQYNTTTDTFTQENRRRLNEL